MRTDLSSPCSGPVSFETGEATGLDKEHHPRLGCRCRSAVERAIALPGLCNITEERPADDFGQSDALDRPPLTVRAGTNLTGTDREGSAGHRGCHRGGREAGGA
jgi:hypothetical protein